MELRRFRRLASSVVVALLALPGARSATGATDRVELSFDGPAAVEFAFRLEEPTTVRLVTLLTTLGADGHRVSFDYWTAVDRSWRLLGLGWISHSGGWGRFDAFAGGQRLELAPDVVAGEALRGLAGGAFVEAGCQAAAVAGDPRVDFLACEVPRRVGGPVTFGSSLTVSRVPRGEYRIVNVEGASEAWLRTAFRLEFDPPVQEVSWVATGNTGFLNPSRLDDRGGHASAENIGLGASASVGTSRAFEVGDALFGFSWYPSEGEVGLHEFTLTGPGGTREADDLLFLGEAPGRYELRLSAVYAGALPGRAGLLFADLPPV